MALAIGRLLDQSGNVHLGTGFVISTSRALTAFHCIGEHGSGAVVYQHVTLAFPTGHRVAATFAYGDPVTDYAVLLVVSELPADLKPVPLLTRGVPHEPFRAAGFPGSVEGPDITYIGGRLTAAESSIFGGVPAIQLFCDEGAHGLSLNGMSGAPVLVRDPEAAVGLVRWNPPRADAPQLGVGGIVFAAPANLIVESHPELANLAVPIAHEAKINGLRPTFEALSGVERDQLAHALKALHREKLAETAYHPFEPEWTTIPTWTLDLSIGGQPERVQKDLVRVLVRTIARGIEELCVTSAPEVQVLVLLKLRTEGDAWRVTVISPWHELVGYLTDNCPPRAAVDVWREATDKLAADVTHQYAVVLDALTPIAFRYRPALRQMLATNKVQMSDPEQFLQPQLCKTTSHFLNFVGTISMHYRMAETEGKTPVFLFEDIDNLFDAGLDHWFAWLYFWIDTSTLIDLDRLFVGAKNPEEYRYHYVPGAMPATGAP
mgnify:CR=1 FL=1